MSALAWNCRGLANPRAIWVLKDLVQEKRPCLISLSETLVKNERMDWERAQLGYEGLHGHCGGLGMLWKKKDNHFSSSVLRKLY